MSSGSQSTKELDPRKTTRKKIEKYKMTPNADTESNPLDWWKVNAVTYPIMSKLAKKYLCISASCSASKRVFSKRNVNLTK